MSGVYIKGMEMPKEGEYHMTLYVCGDGVAYVDVAELPADEDRFAAVPVPPHGRLIDGDEADAITFKGLAILDNFPAADVRPVVRGRWVHLYGDEWLCNACGFVISTEGSWEHPLHDREKFFCEHCGARMSYEDSSHSLADDVMIGETK